MKAATFSEFLEEIAPDRQDAFKRDYRVLQELPGAGTDLQAFLDDFLRQTIQLFAASGGAVWFRSPVDMHLALTSRLRYDRLGLDADHEQAHRALLRYAVSCSRSFLVKPFSAPAERIEVSNPTDSFLLLGPIENEGERIGVVELFLGPTPPRGQTAGDRNRYVLWLDHLIEYLRQGIRLRFLGSAAPLQPAMVNLAAARAEIDAFQDAICRSLEVTLNCHAGWNFGTLLNNKTFAKAVHELLDTYGLRVACPECGAPAILRCQSAGNSKTGVFLYDHYLDKGRTFHGGPSTFPHVKLVAKPPRRKSN